MKRITLPLLATLGVVGVVLSLVHNSKAEKVEAAPLAAPAAAPYASYIAAAGIVEASSRNIAIATPVAGTVARVAVGVGDAVRKGQPLFMLDDRDLQAQLAVRRAALESDRSKVAEAEAALGDVQSQLRLAEALTDRRAISAEDLSKRKYAVLLADAKVKTARADVEAAQALVDETLTNMDREVVRAPVDAQVLQVNIRPGEFAPTGVLPSPLLVVGSTRELRVRVDIDEADQWRFHPGAHARAYVRGNRDFAANLAFQYVEPYIVPKVSLTGDTSQRVDTRVLQVVYSFTAGDLPAYVGQQLDVFVESSQGPASPAQPQSAVQRVAS